MQVVGERASTLVPGTDVGARRRIRGFRLTPPAMLMLAAVVIVAGAVALATVSIGASATRLEVVHGVERDDAPRLIDAQSLYVALAHADATSTAFLRAGLEPRELRARYAHDIQDASDRLTAITGRGGLAEESNRAIETISRGLPIYAGLIESARSNSRQELGMLGAQNLRDASTQMRTELLVAAQTLYERAARDLYSHYRRGTTSLAIRAVSIAAGLLLFILLAVQVVVAVASRRVLNLGLLLATLVVIALATLSAGALAIQENALRKSQREGAEQLLTLSTARILALQSLADVNLDLIARGTENQYLDDFALRRSEIGGRQTGLLLNARINAERTHTEEVVNEIVTHTKEYFDRHDRAHPSGPRSLDVKDVTQRVGKEATAEAGLDQSLERELLRDGERLSTHAKDARTTLDRIAVFVAVFAVLAAALAVFGLQRRIREYS